MIRYAIFKGGFRVVNLDMNYQEYCEYIKQQKKAYIDYLVDESYFNYLYLQKIKGTKYPKFSYDNTKVNLEDIRKNVINNTRDFFSGVDLSIKWLDKESAKTLKYKYVFDDHKYIMENAHVGSIFDIPIMAHWYSNIRFHREKSDNFKDIVFYEINLVVDKATEFIESTYFHELGHALILRNWNIVINPLFKEYVSHCFEMFYNYYILKEPLIFVKKLIIRMENRADGAIFLNQCHRELNPFTKGDLIYLIALFLSCITFEKYCDFDSQAKQEMENDFKLVLNGKLVLEDFFEKYDINLHTYESITLFEKTIERVQSYKI